MMIAWTRLVVVKGDQSECIGTHGGGTNMEAEGKRNEA